MSSECCRPPSVQRELREALKPNSPATTPPRGAVAHPLGSESIDANDRDSSVDDGEPGQSSTSDSEDSTLALQQTATSAATTPDRQYSFRTGDSALEGNSSGSSPDSTIRHSSADFSTNVSANTAAAPIIAHDANFPRLERTHDGVARRSTRTRVRPQLPVMGVSRNRNPGMQLGKLYWVWCDVRLTAEEDTPEAQRSEGYVKMPVGPNMMRKKRPFVPLFDCGTVFIGLAGYTRQGRGLEGIYDPEVLEQYIRVLNPRDRRETFPGERGHHAPLRLCRGSIRPISLLKFRMVDVSKREDVGHSFAELQRASFDRLVSLCSSLWNIKQANLIAPMAPPPHRGRSRSPDRGSQGGYYRVRSPTWRNRTRSHNANDRQPSEHVWRGSCSPPRGRPEEPRSRDSFRGHHSRQDRDHSTPVNSRRAMSRHNHFSDVNNVPLGPRRNTAPRPSTEGRIVVPAVNAARLGGRRTTAPQPSTEDASDARANALSGGSLAQSARNITGSVNEGAMHVSTTGFDVDPGARSTNHGSEQEHRRGRGARRVRGNELENERESVQPAQCANLHAQSTPVGLGEPASHQWNSDSATTADVPTTMTNLAETVGNTDLNKAGSILQEATIAKSAAGVAE